MHEHTAWLFTSRHWLLGPHGDGRQTSTGVSITARTININVSKIIIIFDAYVIISISSIDKLTFWRTITEWITGVSTIACTRRCMVDNLADSVGSASTRTRVTTFVLRARFVWWTVGIHNTFRSASFVRVAVIFWQTSTGSGAVIFSAFSICATWRWFTRWSEILYNFHFVTFDERISGVIEHARTRWRMADNMALCVDTTRWHTRINAFLIYTGEVTWTFRIADALWPAVRWWPEILRKTWTWWVLRYYFTDCIRSAWWWFTRVRALWLKLLKYTSREWVSCVLWWAWTDGVVVDNLTFSSNSACALARINAFLIAASFRRGAVSTNGALWSTWRGAPYVSRYTRTNRLPVNVATLTVRSTRARLTWLWFYDWKENIKIIIYFNIRTLCLHNILCSNFDCRCSNLPSITTHWTNAFPVIRSGHLHMGTWFITSHMAFEAQAPWQGFTHLFLRQALSWGQSELSTHSGRHPK